MTLSRAALLDKMTTVEPALSRIDIIPVMGRYWFTGEELAASCDQITIRVPCQTPFAGAAPRHLKDLLAASRARDLEAHQEGAELTLTAARARMRVSLDPTEQFQIFIDAVRADPGAGDDVGAPVGALRDALAYALRSVSGDTSRAEHLGVTVVPSDGAVIFCGTNGKTIARAAVAPVRAMPPRQVILPRAFCEIAVRMLRGAETHTFAVRDDSALLVAGGVTLHGRLIESENPLDFEGVVAQYWPEGGWDALVPVPDTFSLVAARAAVIAESKIVDVHSRVRVRGGRMEITSAATERGEVRDALPVPGHPDVDCTVDPRALREGLEGHDRLLFAPRCCVLGNAESGNIYLVAARSE